MADIDFYSGIEITGNLSISGTLKDSSGDVGTSGQVLSSLGSSGTDWVDAGGAGTNIANTDLTLDAARTLDLDGNSLTFSSNNGGSTDTIASWSYTNMQVFGDFYLRTNSSTSAPTMRFSAGTSSNFVALKAPNTVGTSYTLTLPDADGTDGQVIQTDGSGEMSWVDNNIGSSNLSIPGTSTARTLTLSAGTNASFVIESNGNDPYIQFKKGVTTAYNRLEIQNDSSFGGEFRIYEGNTGSGKYVGFRAPDLITTTAKYTLPVSAPASDKVLQSDSSGVMSWVAGGGTGTNIGTSNLTISGTDTARVLTLSTGTSSSFAIKDTSANTVFRTTASETTVTGLLTTMGGNSTTGGSVLFKEGSNSGSNYIRLQAPATLAANNSYILPTAYPTTGQVLSSTEAGVMSWAAPTPTLIMGGGGRVTISTAVDNNARIVVCGGQYGFNYYAWSENVYGAAPDFTGLGVTVGTISTTLVTPSKANRGQFKSISGGKVQISGTIRSVNSVDIYDSVTYIYVFKVPDAIVTAMGNGTAQSSTAYELVASASCTMPDSDTSFRPQSFASSNGVNIDKDDWIFVGVAFAGTVTANRYLELNFNVYTE
jgi:hypothetical protein